MTTVSIRGRREDMDTETRPCEDVERDRTDGATRGHQKLGREGPPLGSDPQPFWHQGLDSRKTISPRTRVRGMVSGFGTTQEHYIHAHLLLCSPIPNRPGQVPACGPKAGDPSSLEPSRKPGPLDICNSDRLPASRSV